MTAEEFTQKMGRQPEADDLDRVNCTQIGHVGHLACGWCDFCDAPAFQCLRWHVSPEVVNAQA